MVVCAQESAPNNINFPFATYLGAGIYSVKDRTVQVYHFPISFDARSLAERKWGVRLRLPLTFGIYDFDSDDFLVSELPDRVAIFSLVPSLRFPIHIDRHWILTPFVDFGVAKNLDGGSRAWVYGCGFVGEAVYSMPGYELRPILKALWAHHSHPTALFGNDLAKIQPGLEIRVPLWFSVKGQRADIGFFGTNYTFLEELVLVTPDDLPFATTVQWELGLSLGTRTPLKLLGMKMPRIGVSYRFGENIAAVRLILGRPI